jgi:uncharacterized protein YjiS (DUF1127 family)
MPTFVKYRKAPVAWGVQSCATETRFDRRTCRRDLALPKNQVVGWAAAGRHLERLSPQLTRACAAAWRTFCLWNSRRRDRAALRSLSRRDIHDFCPRQTEAETEMNKPFWRA